MHTISRKSGSSKSKSHQTITIPEELVKQLEAIPDKPNIKIVFTALQDKILHDYSGRKSASALSKVLGISETTILRRQKELGLR